MRKREFVCVDPIAREQIEGQALRLTEQIAAQKEANKIALDAAEKAVLKAENASEKRFEGVNEFRQTLSDQAATFATRNELDAKLETVNASIKRLEKGEAATEGRYGISTPLLLGLVAAVAAAVGHYLFK